jgi:predicted nucleotidyltransferase
MTLRDLPRTFSRAAVAAIDARLADIERDHGVSIPLAIESGSRAWGFPSPDSDYDCRFVFVRPLDHYLSPWQQRDVIETPLEGDLDVNGWDLAKAIKLLLKGNAVIIEWLTSPIVYGGDSQFRDEFLALAARHASRELIGRHYLHLGDRQRRVYFGEGRRVAQKKIFYALRPAAALRWLRLHPDDAVAPMHFPTLMAECDAPRDVMALTQDLTARKAVLRELGDTDLPEPIARFIDQEFESARAVFETKPVVISEAAKRDADAFFRATVLRLDRTKP